MGFRQKRLLKRGLLRDANLKAAAEVPVVEEEEVVEKETLVEKVARRVTGRKPRRRKKSS